MLNKIEKKSEKKIKDVSIIFYLKSFSKLKIETLLLLKKFHQLIEIINSLNLHK